VLAAMLLATAPGRAAVPNPDLQAQTEGNTAFACDLYARLKTEKAGANLFFSPYSLSTALAMTYAGARGPTAEQMAGTLHFGLDQARLHPAFFALEESLAAVQKKGRVTLGVANSLWPQNGYPFREEYLDLARHWYGVTITPVDYARAADEARQKINAWVEDKTNRKIVNLIPAGVLNPLTRLVLANAIYFKGDWASRFKAVDTQEQPFNLGTGETVQAHLMYQQAKDQFRYAETDTMQALDLPYAGNDLSMLVLLPKKNDGLPALESELTAANLSRWTRQLRPQEVKAYLPKFKVTCEFGLNTALKALGMKDAFETGRADFSGMDGRQDLYISAVLHKAFVEVNEEGTEAAAATAVVIGLRSVAAPKLPAVFRADHPFLFLIRERSTGAVLFLGRVINPSK
jgi:serpin B